MIQIPYLKSWLAGWNSISVKYCFSSNHGSAEKNQLIQDQGTTVFQQCHEMQGNKFDKQIHFRSAPPKSVGEYLAEKSSEDAFTRRRQENAAQKLEEKSREEEKERNRDELDELFSDELQDPWWLYKRTLNWRKDPASDQKTTFVCEPMMQTCTLNLNNVRVKLRNPKKRSWNFWDQF